jgi:hypothetical protein
MTKNFFRILTENMGVRTRDGGRAWREIFKERKVNISSCFPLNFKALPQVSNVKPHKTELQVLFNFSCIYI